MHIDLSLDADAPPSLARAIPRGATWALEHSRGRQVQCLEGTLWITLDTHAQDHVLERGECWTVPARADERLLVHALRDARVRVLDLN